MDFALPLISKLDQHPLICLKIRLEFRSSPEHGFVAAIEVFGVTLAHFISETGSICTFWTGGTIHVLRTSVHD